MKERPIDLDPRMVRAIRAGLKTQHRRPTEPLPGGSHAHDWAASYDRLVGLCQLVEHSVTVTYTHGSPLGRPGDRLYVREEYALWSEQGEGEGPGIAYRSDDLSFEPMTSYWREAARMPRRLSRFTLEIVSVHVERLCFLSSSDARAEGICPGRIAATGDHPELQGYMVGPDDGVSLLEKTPQDAYRDFWNKAHADRPDLLWDANPFVDVVTFRRLILPPGSEVGLET
jgi:hypothetical protein